MDPDTERLLYPYVTTPRRIALDVVAALEACPAIARVAIYGSLAPFGPQANNDGYADIDVLAHVEGEDGPWQAAHAIRRAIPLRWHGRFSDRDVPSGRHWPLGEAPFHCIDLGLFSAVEFDAVLRDGLRGHPLRAELLVDRPGIATPGRPTLAVCADEYDFTHALYMATKALKDYLRERVEWDAVPAAMKELEGAARTLAVRPPGSDPDDVLNEMRTLYFALMNERVRYGGNG